MAEATDAGGLGPAIIPERAGTAITVLVSGPGPEQDAYLLTAEGLSSLT